MPSFPFSPRLLLYAPPHTVDVGGAADSGTLGNPGNCPSTCAATPEAPKEPEMDADETVDSLLGTLRSELDEDDDGGLHPSFEILAGLVVTVRTAYTSFRITPEQAARICAQLRLEGRDGNEWTVGATSGAWYRRRTGEIAWQKSPLPINVIPVDGAVPKWLTDGIAGEILAAEKATKVEAQSDGDVAGDGDGHVSGEGSDPMDAFTRGAINPFQRKHVDESFPVVASGAPKITPSADQMDIDWILEEWEELDREEATVRGANETRGGLKGKLPPELDPDTAERNALGEQTGPTAREGSVTQGDAPVERDGPISPDDYFLRPDA